MTSLVDGNHKLIRRRLPRERSGVMLFDLEQDASETHDLSQERPEERLRLLRSLDEIERTLSGGLYLELRNHPGPTAQSRLRGTIEALDASVLGATLDEERPGRQVSVSADGRRVSFDVTLRNEPVPFRQARPVVLDLVRLRLTVADASRLRLTLTADPSGGPLPALLVGSSGVSQVDPLEIDSEDPALLVEPGEADITQASEGPTIRLYRLPGPTSEAADIDQDLRDRLEALGYAAGS
jgi:hypothetical protein